MNKSGFHTIDFVLSQENGKENAYQKYENSSCAGRLILPFFLRSHTTFFVDQNGFLRFNFYIQCVYHYTPTLLWKWRPFEMANQLEGDKKLRGLALQYVGKKCIKWPFNSEEAFYCSYLQTSTQYPQMRLRGLDDFRGRPNNASRGGWFACKNHRNNVALPSRHRRPSEC